MKNKKKIIKELKIRNIVISFTGNIIRKYNELFEFFKL